MRSLLLNNGDLVVGAGGFLDVSGTPKVIQDLGVAIREPFGSDRFHALYGSLLDRYVGMLVNGVSEQLVKSEISRVIQNYALIQQDQMKRDSLKGFVSRYSLDEIVSTVESIKFYPSYDSFQVTVVVRTAGGQLFTLSSSQAA